MPRSLPARVIALIAFALSIAGLATPVGADDEEASVTVCHDGSLARQRTEIGADISLPGFDASLGTLLEVEVPIQSVHLETDASFENTAQSAVTFEEHMTYQVTFTSPGGLASPPPLSGTIERVPTQTLAAFDGTLDYLGASAVKQPSTTRDAGAIAVGSTDPAVLNAFTGGAVAFHVASSIGETFTGGGGNIEFQINTFASAAVRVCYRYAPPSPPTTTPPTTRPTARRPPAPVPATPVVAPRALVFTG